jgi:chlorinating enzyme
MTTIVTPAPGLGETWSDSEVVDHATPEQVAFYRDQGYLKFGRIFTQAEMDALRDHVDEMIAALPEGKRPEEMDRPHLTDPWLFRYLTHPRVLDVIQDFIGPDIVLWSSHFIAKPRGDGKRVPWHTDGAYWNQALRPMKVITLWLAVDPSVVENGCMRVIPASQHQGATLDSYEPVEDKSQNVFGVRLRQDLVDESRAVDLELKRGECHFHDAWTIHGSNPNFSSMRRCGYTMRYMPANVVYREEGWTLRDHKIYLVRGQDRTDGKNRYAPIPEF